MKLYNLIQESNDFIIKSGIRKYCSTICNGSCCTSDCYAKKTNNFNHCHTHLPCVLYYCKEIGEIIYHISEVDGEKLYSYKEVIYNMIYKYLPSYDTNIFFTPYSLLDHDNIKKSFPKLSEEFYKKMSRAMEKAIEKKYKRYKLYKLKNNRRCHNENKIYGL